MDDRHTVVRQVLDLLDRGTAKDEIVAQLLQTGHAHEFAEDIVTETARNRDLKRRSQGFALILAGAVICLGSFIVTFVTSTDSSSSLPYTLYGATTVGILIAFAGLMKVF